MRYPLQSSDNQGADAGDMIRRIPQLFVGIGPFRLYGRGCSAGDGNRHADLYGPDLGFAHRHAGTSGQNRPRQDSKKG